MKLFKLLEELDDTEVPGAVTDPGTSVSKKSAEVLKTPQMVVLAIYLAIEKDSNFMEMYRELRSNPNYGPMLYNNIGRSKGIIKELSNPFTMQEVASMFEDVFDPSDFLTKWASEFYPAKGKFGVQFILLYWAHRIRTGKKLNIEEVVQNRERAMTLYRKYGGSKGILKYLSKPEAIGELARMYNKSEFAFNYFRHLINAIAI